jgi:type IV pilus assembly protein PilY1
MRSADWLRANAPRLRSGLLGAALSCYVSAPAYAAFNPSQVPLLSAAAVTPNVMLQVDNSGSMDTVLADSGYLPDFNYGRLFSIARSAQYNPTYSRGSAYSTLTDYFFYASLPNRGIANCNDNQFGFWGTTSVVCLTLPDPEGSGGTRYPVNFLVYLVAKAAAGTPVTVTNDTRMKTAISVAVDLVNSNTDLRMGLATFNGQYTLPSDTSDRGPSGRIVQDIADLSKVTALGDRPAVSETKAASNQSNLVNSIKGLSAIANTPLAETYYQVTRYFRGLEPYPRYSGAPARFTSPIQYRCQRNYGVVITDGLPTFDRTFSPSPKDPDDPQSLLPNWDGKSSDDGENANKAPNQKTDNEGDDLFLDDIAKFAYDIDMKKATSSPGVDLAKKSWDDPAFLQQNVSTYTVGFTASNDMLSQAATYGHGVYYQAADKAQLAAALGAALSDINAKAGSGGGGASSSSTLQTGTQFYQTLYDPTDWHGTIKAFNLGSSGGLDSSAKPAWNTDDTIIPGGSGTTFDTWNTGNNTVVPLDFASISLAQQTSLILTRSLTGGYPLLDLAPPTSAHLINWSKGIERTDLRTRTKLLGDIINSPLVVSLPSDKTASDLVGDSSYTTYLAKKASVMTPRIVVNSNDGFMNVIDTSNGQRSYAFMPSTAINTIPALARPDYGINGHKFTVDGQLGVFDTQLSAGGAWQTIAIGGTGAGGKAYFAVRLFDGTSNTAKALWETAAPDVLFSKTANMGYAYSKPAVARLKNGAGVVIVGNGYGSASGGASLFVLNIATGAVLREIPVPAALGSTDNGLSSVRVVVDSQNVAQAAYAGDLKGRLWKFDLSGGSVESWKVAFNGAPLFTTPRGADQPITVQPLVLDHPTNGKLVYFGTGKFNETADKTTTALQDFYAIWDSTSGSGSIVESNLQPQAITSTTTINGSQYITTSTNEVDWTSKKGWYLPLATAAPYLGERVIYPAQTSRGRIIFTTAAVNSSDPCESTGTGRLLELDAEKGKMLSYPVLDTNGDGQVNSSDQIVSGLLFGSGLPNLAAIVAGTPESSATTGTSGGSTDTKYVPDSSGKITVLIEKGGDSTTLRRIMWRQIQ